jgi:hypothetical protein
MPGMNRAKKKLLCAVAGAFLYVVCGTLVGIGLILSWYPPWHDPATFLKFVFHPTTLLFFVGAWLLFRGLLFRGLFKSTQDSGGHDGGSPS